MARRQCSTRKKMYMDEYNRERVQYYISEGICIECGEAEAIGVRCEDCTEGQRIKTAALMASRRAAGICGKCPRKNDRASVGGLYCTRCVTRRRQRSARAKTGMCMDCVDVRSDGACALCTALGAESKNSRRLSVYLYIKDIPDCTVYEISKATKMSVRNVLRHLKGLATLGIVSRREDDETAKTNFIARYTVAKVVG